MFELRIATDGVPSIITDDARLVDNIRLASPTYSAKPVSIWFTATPDRAGALKLARGLTETFGWPARIVHKLNLPPVQDYWYAEIAPNAVAGAQLDIQFGVSIGTLVTVRATNKADGTRLAVGTYDGPATNLTVAHDHRAVRPPVYVVCVKTPLDEMIVAKGRDVVVL